MTTSARGRRWSVVAAAVLLGTSLTACGGDSGSFDASVAEVRAAVAAGDRDTALAGLESLAIDGLAAHESGDLTDAELDELARLIASSRQQVETLLPTTTTSSSTTTTSPPPPDADDDHDGGKGKGKGKKDDEDD